MTPPDSTLKPRELEILKLVAAGLSNKEIAYQVRLAIKTVEHMLGTSDPFRSIYLKIGVGNRAGAAAWYTSHYGRPGTSSGAPTLIEQLLAVYSDYASRMYEMRTIGQPLVALDMARFLKTQIELFLQDYRLSAERDALYRLQAIALVEEALVYLEVMQGDQVLALVQPLFQEFEIIAKELNDPQILGLGYISVAGAYNIGKQYAVGHKLYWRAFDLFNSVDLQLRALRGIAISSAFLDNNRHVEFASQETRRRIDDGNFTRVEQVCETVEGISKARGLLRVQDTYCWFEEAEAMLAQLNYHPLRRLQIITSKLEVMRLLDPENVLERERLGEEGISVAKHHEYLRHQKRIVELLDR